ncbi:MAG: acyltransferase family protein [Vicinamibacteria bacterium]
MASIPGRLVSLDAFRGLTIASMILVNNPGSWGAIYWPLAHAEWHGWTPTDLIFPFFLFMVGISIHFSSKSSLRQALRRTAVLFGLGLFMAAFPFFNLGTLRIPGVLQRIALCYLAAFLLRRVLGAVGQAVACAALLAGYWLLMTQLPLPDGGAPNLDPGTNLSAYVDRTFLSGHMWRQTKTWDPEGLLSTLPAIATTLLGLLAGVWMRGKREPMRKALGMLGGGLVLTAAGLAWGESFPINKSLWTSSYVLLTGGLAAACFGVVYLLADVLGRRRWTGPAVVYGTNAIFVFVASGLVAKLLAIVKLGDKSLQALLHETLFASWLAPKDASLAFAIANIACWYLVLLWMDRRGLHLKV